MESHALPTPCQTELRECLSVWVCSVVFCNTSLLIPRCVSPLCVRLFYSDANAAEIRNAAESGVASRISSLRLDHLPTLLMAKACELSLLVKSLLVAEWLMPALLLRLLLQCAGDIKMNTGPDLTPTPTNCLQLMQWNQRKNH